MHANVVTQAETLRVLKIALDRIAFVRRHDMLEAQGALSYLDWEKILRPDTHDWIRLGCFEDDLFYPPTFKGSNLGWTHCCFFVF